MRHNIRSFIKKTLTLHRIKYQERFEVPAGVARVPLALPVSQMVRDLTAGLHAAALTVPVSSFYQNVLPLLATHDPHLYPTSCPPHGPIGIQCGRCLRGDETLSTGSGRVCAVAVV